VDYRAGYSHTEDLQILNNTIIDPLHYGVNLVDNYGVITVQNNIIVSPGTDYINGTPDVESDNLETMTIADCGFVNVVNDDYHLAVGSDAIGAGHDVSDYGIDFDYDGEPRPFGDYDQGAFEYQVASTGELAKTLTVLELIAAGTVGVSVTINGVLTKTLTGLQLIANGSIGITGSLAKTLSSLELISAGIVTGSPATIGDLAKTLASLELLAAGTITGVSTGTRGCVQIVFDSNTVTMTNQLTGEVLITYRWCDD
jgi:hypothetical protein